MSLAQILPGASAISTGNRHSAVCQPPSDSPHLLCQFPRHSYIFRKKTLDHPT
jgi:hypothetical protein